MIRFSKICKTCGKQFVPTGKFCKVCWDCKSKHWSKRKNNINSNNHKKSKMVYEPKFQPCPYRTSNNHCVNKRIKGKHCGYKRVELCPYYNEWLKGKKMDSDCVEMRERDISPEVCNE